MQTGYQIVLIVGDDRDPIRIFDRSYAKRDIAPEFHVVMALDHNTNWVSKKLQVYSILLKAVFETGIS